MHNSNCFKMPNKAIGELSCSEIKVLAALHSIRCKSIYRGKKYIQITQAVIARVCGISSTTTVSSAIDSLRRKGYITDIKRYYTEYKMLGAYVYVLPVLKQNYFFVDRKIFKFKLSGSQFRMYMFFCKAAVSSNRSSWNSFKDISEKLGVSRSSVIKAINELVALKLIKKQRVIKKDGSYSDNHYEVVSVRLNKKYRIKKRGHMMRTYAHKENYKNLKKIFTSHIVNEYYVFVNGMKLFFIIRGSPKNCGTYSSTHFITNRRKNKIKLYLKYRCNLTIYDKKK